MEPIASSSCTSNVFKLLFSSKFQWGKYGGKCRRGTIKTVLQKINNGYQS